METTATALRHAMDSLCAEMEGFIGEDRPLRNINPPGSSIIVVGATYAFDELTVEKQRLRSKLAADFDHLALILVALTRAQPEDVRRKLGDRLDGIRQVIEQRLVYHRSTGAALQAVRKGLADVSEVLSGLHDPAEGSTILIPDTNALIHSPSFQRWSFGGLAEFVVLLVPAVLSELDKLKVEHRNPDVRHKANDLIRQIKEYRRRGPLMDGVIVVVNRITLRSLAVEPDVEGALPWLDPASQDDRIVASCIEVMRAHPRSVVGLVTGDINLQNKAEFARIPYLEPPTASSANGAGS